MKERISLDKAFGLESVQRSGSPSARLADEERDGKYFTAMLDYCRTQQQAGKPVIVREAAEHAMKTLGRLPKAVDTLARDFSKWRKEHHIPLEAQWPPSPTRSEFYTEDLPAMKQASAETSDNPPDEQSQEDNQPLWQLDRWHMYLMADYPEYRSICERIGFAATREQAKDRPFDPNDLEWMRRFRVAVQAGVFPDAAALRRIANAFGHYLGAHSEK